MQVSDGGPAPIEGHQIIGDDDLGLLRENFPEVIDGLNIIFDVLIPLGAAQLHRVSPKNTLNRSESQAVFGQLGPEQLQILARPDFPRGDMAQMSHHERPGHHLAQPHQRHAVGMAVPAEGGLHQKISAMSRRINELLKGLLIKL